MMREVEFDSQGTRLRGRLYEQPGLPDSPALVMAHGFSATIDGMVADLYAEAFQADGFTVLLFDHAHLGRSDGEPRQLISVWRQARGYIDALSFLASQPGVSRDRLGLWGDSLSAGEALLVAAIDARVAVLVVQVPACGRELPPCDVDLNAYIEAVREMLGSDFSTLAYGPASEQPVVSIDQLHAASWLVPPTAYRWFVEYGSRFGTNWHNRAIRAEPVKAPPYYPALAAAALRIPSLFVIAREDEMPGSKPEVALHAYQNIQGPKQLLEIPGGHFGLLDHRSDVFERVSQAETLFLDHYLK